MQDLYQCVFNSWSPTIGDPTVLGWITVAIYGVSAICVWIVGGRNRGTERLIWRLIALMLALLMINKQLDLQSFLTAAGRCHAQSAGWYEDRGKVQMAFILGVLVVSLLSALAMLIFLYRLILRNLLLFAGTIMLLSFIVIRAVGFHGFDQLIGLRIGPFAMNHVLELGSLSLFLLACLVRVGWRRSGDMNHER